jgi:hypothetical protein
MTFSDSIMDLLEVMMTEYYEYNCDDGGGVDDEVLEIITQSWIIFDKRLGNYKEGDINAYRLHSLNVFKKYECKYRVCFCETYESCEKCKQYDVPLWKLKEMKN